MKILLLGNAPWAWSGYGEQIALLVPRFQALGHEVACAANFGLQAMTAPWGGIPVYPASSDWGNTSIGSFAEHFGADLVLCLHDAWVMKPDVWPEDMQMAIWAPVDHYPVPPAVLGVLQHEKVRPIAMSRFGEEWMKRFLLDPLYAPHAIDTALFRPQPEIKDAVRDELEIPRDAFLVGMVAANKGSPQFPRKSFPQAFEAFARFAAEHDDAWLYVHTQTAPDGGGIDLAKLLLAVDSLSPNAGHLAKRVRFPSNKVWHLGLPREVIASLYAAFDVLLNPSMGEGFGIPILEAQASGVPVIASDHSAMSELTQAGWLVSGDPWWDALQESFAFIPSIASIEAALEAAYETRADQGIRSAAVEFAQAYDADLVAATYWEPILEQLAKPREVPPLNVNGNRAQRRAAAKKKVKA